MMDQVCTVKQLMYPIAPSYATSSQLLCSHSLKTVAKLRDVKTFLFRLSYLSTLCSDLLTAIVAI